MMSIVPVMVTNVRILATPDIAIQSLVSNKVEGEGGLPLYPVIINISWTKPADP